ncbi:MAG TPA: outer membrane beta-barrel protein, partial [Gammaproteobacteria bacterium]|nr:outer membrane beta-barrel protein [Gammaproteobacteria bacterium]
MTATCAAGAEEAIPDDAYSRIPVGDRPHPEYDPIGYRVGSVFIYPKLSGGVIYNSNVFASHRNPRADFAALISPELTIRYGKLPQVYPVEPSRFSAELNLG